MRQGGIRWEDERRAPDLRGFFVARADADRRASDAGQFENPGAPKAVSAAKKQIVEKTVLFFRTAASAKNKPPAHGLQEA